MLATGEQGRLVIEAGAGVHRCAGYPLDVRLAQGTFDETGHAVALAGADQRADFVVGIALAGETQAADGRTELGHQAVMNPGLGINAASGGAILAGVVVAVGAYAFDHGLNVGIVADDHRGLATEFEVGAFECLRRGLENLLAGDDIAGQRHHAHFRVAHQVAADAFAATANNVDYTARQDLGQRWRQGQDRQRRVFRRLEHQGVASGEGRGDFPRGHHDRVVPRRNRRHDPDRIAPDHAGVARQVFAAELAGLATHGTGEEAEHVDRGIEVILTGQVQRLAAIQGFETGEMVGVFFDGVGDVQQQV
ncbi:hypothetical protein D3C81_1297300 [compost metagenome]